MNKHSAMAYSMHDAWDTYAWVDSRTGKTQKVTLEELEQLLFEEQQEQKNI